MNSKLIILALLVAGIALNKLVFYLNGGMPSPVAYSFPPTSYKKWTPLTDQTRLAFLADIFLFPWGYSSIGDILIIAGVGLCFFLLVRWGVKKWNR